MSFYNYGSTLLDYCELIKDDELTDEQLTESRKEILYQKFRLFMKDISFEFEVFDTPTLNDELKEQFFRIFLYRYFDMQVSVDPEYAWKLYFERIYLEKIDRYNKKLKVQLVSLSEIDKTLYENYNMVIDFEQNETNERNRTGNNKEVASTTKNDTETTDKTNTITDNGSDTESQTVRDFNRNLYQETPNGQLGITATDGQGVIATATTINEDLENKNQDTERTNKNTRTDVLNQSKDSNETNNYNSDKDSTIDETGKIDVTNQRNLKGYQSLGSKGKLLSDYQNLFEDTLYQFVNCFDNLFRHVY